MMLMRGTLRPGFQALILKGSCRECAFTACHQKIFGMFIYLSLTLTSLTRSVPSFFDVGGVMQDPKALSLVTDIFAERAAACVPPPTHVCGLDARGFVFGPLVAQKLGLPFFMMRKKGKLPGPVMEAAYETEYSSEVLTIPCSAVGPGDNVLIYDDLIATGGTTIAAAQLILHSGASVAEVHVVTAIAFFKGWQKFRSSLPELADVPIFAIVEATNALSMPEGSTDSFVVTAGSAEHKAIVAAKGKAMPGTVLAKRKRCLAPKWRRRTPTNPWGLDSTLNTQSRKVENCVAIDACA